MSLFSQSFVLQSCVNSISCLTSTKHFWSKWRNSTIRHALLLIVKLRSSRLGPHRRFLLRNTRKVRKQCKHADYDFLTLQSDLVITDSMEKLQECVGSHQERNQLDLSFHRGILNDSPSFITIMFEISHGGPKMAKI